MTETYIRTILILSITSFIISDNSNSINNIATNQSQINKQRKMFLKSSDDSLNMNEDYSGNPDDVFQNKSSQLIFLQNSEDGTDQLSLNTINSKVNALHEANAKLTNEYIEVIKEIRDLSRENKSIIARLINIETSLSKTEEISSLIKEVDNIKSKVNYAATEEMITKIEKLSETNNEIDKAFTFIKNNQSKLEMKTVKLDRGLEDFMLKQELKVNEFIKETKESQEIENKKIRMRTNRYTSIFESDQVYIKNISIDAKQLSEAIMDNNKVTELVLANNQLGEKGVKEISEALKQNKSITKIIIHQNQTFDFLILQKGFYSNMIKRFRNINE